MCPPSTQIVDGLGGILYAYPFKVPAYYALILRSLLVLEGLAFTSDPNFKVLARAYPFFANKLLSDVTPQLRDSLAELLFAPDGAFRWGRLEGLLEQSVLSEDYDAGRTLQPLVALALAPDPPPPAPPNRLRALVEAEAARVAEALIYGSTLEAARAAVGSPMGYAAAALQLQLPGPFAAQLQQHRAAPAKPAAAATSSPLASSPAATSGASTPSGPPPPELEENSEAASERMLALRATVLRCWALYSAASGSAVPAAAAPAAAAEEEGEEEGEGEAWLLGRFPKAGLTATAMWGMAVRAARAVGHRPTTRAGAPTCHTVVARPCRPRRRTRE